MALKYSLNWAVGQAVRMPRAYLSVSPCGAYNAFAKPYRNHFILAVVENGKFDFADGINLAEVQAIRNAIEAQMVAA